MISLNGTECLLVSRDSELLRIITASLAEVGMPVTICSQEERVLELAGEGNCTLIVIDLQSMPAASELVHCVRPLGRQSMLVGVGSKLKAIKPPLVEQLNLVLIKPVSARRVKNSLKRLLEATGRYKSNSGGTFSSTAPGKSKGVQPERPIHIGVGHAR